MTRRGLEFDCAGARLCGTLDEAAGDAGLLIVSGGNEIRSGAWGGQAQLAARVAAAGHPVLRYDRRGVGDSEGENCGFRTSAPDIAAALLSFRGAQPQLRRVVGFGNCDAASALALFAADLPLDGLLLANPWTVDGESDAAPVHSASGLRRRYAGKLGDPGEWKRLLTGGVDVRKLAGGLRQAAGAARTSALGDAMAASLARFAGPVTILVAEGDRTAQLFLEAWDAADPRIARLDSASHSFSGEPDRDWLFDRVTAALRYSAA